MHQSDQPAASSDSAAASPAAPAPTPPAPPPSAQATRDLASLEEGELEHADDAGGAPPTFPIVGIGASAGGLEALQRFFEKVLPDSGMAYVVVQHLSPDFKSLMEELLARYTRVPIRRVTDGMVVEPDVIYLIPPNADMILTGGRLHLTDRDPEQALTLPIDLFFRSLAQDAGARAVAVVLSGSGSDGSRGVRAVHEAGGLVLAQDERTAKFDGMPRSTIDTGIVDLVLPPEAMPAALALQVSRPGAPRGQAPIISPEAIDGLGPIFSLLRREYGIDFSHYKPTTVARRVQRRLALTEVHDLDEYLVRLQEHPQELDVLYRDLLIGVTRFFRDADAFAKLRECIGPLLQRIDPADEMRVWVAGCATGEEAYTVTMLILETMRVLGRRPKLKVFATDAHRASLEVAGAGRYDAEAIRLVPPDLRDRYFQPHGEGWLARPELRTHVVFAPHNVLRDAPFTRLDLITCRNLLIYFQPQAQRKVISLFHFGLKAGGLLLLGPSESPGELAEEFQPVDEHWKLYRKRRDIRLPTEVRLAAPEFQPRSRRAPRAQGSYEQTLHEGQEALLRAYAPPTFLVDERGELLHTFNGAGKYLAPRDGPSSLGLIELVHKDLKFSVAHGLKRAVDRREETTFPGVRLRTEDGEHVLEVSVRPIVRGEHLESVLISMRDDPPVAVVGQAPGDGGEMNRLAAERIDALEYELRQTKENLQATLEEMETSNEELQATNEELVASNEELQSTNEELHSVNEELYTVNAEHQQKILELTELSADMDNLLSATEVHTLFLDEDLRLRKFTPKMGETFHLLPQDLGRRIDTFTHTLEHPDLVAEIRATLEDGRPREQEVRDRAGRWYLLRILPYRVRDRHDGVVFTLVDITALKAAQQDLHVSVERYRTLVQALTSAVFVCGAAGRFDTPQAEWEAFTGQRWPAYRGQGWLEAVHPTEKEAVRDAWTSAVERRAVCEARGRIWSEPRGEYRHFVLRAAPLTFADGSVKEWIGTLADVHEERLAEQAHRVIEQQLQGLLANSPTFIYVKDLQGRYQLANPQARTVLGVPPDELRGRTDHDVLPVEVADAIRANDRRVAQNGTSVHEFEETIPGPGGPRTYLSNKFPLRADDGSMVGVAGISLDISERKRAAQEVQLAVERRDRFLAMLSHELRNPLAAMLNAVYALTRADLSAGLRERAPRIIQRQVQHMGRLLDDLLDVARLTQDRIAVRRERLDFKKVVAEAVESARDAYRSAGVELAVTLCEPPAWLDGDPARLQQVVANLLSNAAKYTPAGGRTELVVECQAAQVVLTVRDNGIGIEKQQLGRIFELFYQADTSLDRARGGLGVGLSLVRSLVHLHGGEVSAASAGPGQGSEFVVRLPRELALPAPAAPLPLTDGEGQEPMRVVLVEDLSDGRDVLAQVLTESGYHVDAAPDGVAGLQMIQDRRPDVAIVDIGLPGLDGYELARRVRAAPGGHAIHLISLTGYGRAEDRRRALDAGFDEHLVKPLSPEVVLAVLEGVRSRGRR